MNLFQRIAAKYRKAPTPEPAMPSGMGPATKRLTRTDPDASAIVKAVKAVCDRAEDNLDKRSLTLREFARSNMEELAKKYSSVLLDRQPDSPNFAVTVKRCVQNATLEERKRAERAEGEAQKWRLQVKDLTKTVEVMQRRLESLNKRRKAKKPPRKRA